MDFAMKRVLLEPAYVLHRRSYRETSFLVELFTPEHGRLTVVAKGVRKARSPMPGLLQPFIPLLVSWSGRGELMTLSHTEVNGEVKRLQADCLFAGFYLNELLMCLLQKGDAHPGLYRVYENAISGLQTEVLEQKILRSFEKYLLEELGYGILPKSDVSLHNTFWPDKYYRFISEQGFVLSELGDQSQSKSNIFSGQSLINIAKEDWQKEETLQDAKRLARFLLAPLLGSRPIYSRRLFMPPPERSKKDEKCEE
jgi:DNA repair protein RecO (recombination protein O)